MASKYTEEERKQRQRESQLRYYHRTKKLKGNRIVNNYINNKELTKEAMDSIKLGYRTKRLDEMFILINKNIFSKLRHKYNSYDDAHDVMIFGLLKLFENWDLFDPSKGKAFSYYSEICKRGFVYGLNYVVKQDRHGYNNPTIIHYDFNDIRREKNNI